MTLFLLNNQTFQLIIAEELKYQLGIKDADSILTFRTSSVVKNPRFGINSQDKVSAFGNWPNTYTLELVTSSNFYYFIQTTNKYDHFVAGIVKKYPQIDTLVLGNYGNEPMRHLATKYSKKGKKIIFLDEGIGTLHLYKTRVAKRTGTLKTGRKARLKYSITSLIKKYFFNIKVSDVAGKVTFFTSYRNLKETPDTRILINEFTKFRSNLPPLNIDKHVYFLAGAFVRSQWISLATYRKYLKFIFTYYREKGLPVNYIAHRREDESNISDLAAEYNVQILKLDSPIEIYFYEKKIQPHILSGITSSGILNVHEMYGGKIKTELFLMDKRDVYPAKYEILVEINNYFEQVLPAEDLIQLNQA